MKSRVDIILVVGKHVIFKVGNGPRYQTKVADFMTIYRISIGRMTLRFSLYFNFNINVLANIW